MAQWEQQGAGQSQILSTNEAVREDKTLQTPFPTEILSSAETLLEFSTIPKQCHPLGSKCSNTRAHEGHFLFKPLTSPNAGNSVFTRSHLQVLRMLQDSVTLWSFLLAPLPVCWTGVWGHRCYPEDKRVTHLIIPRSPIPAKHLGLKVARGFSEIMMEQFGDLYCPFRKYEVFFVTTELAATPRFCFVFPNIIEMFNVYQ